MQVVGVCAAQIVKASLAQSVEVSRIIITLNLAQAIYNYHSLVWRCEWDSEKVMAAAAPVMWPAESESDPGNQYQMDHQLCRLKGRE